MPMNIFSSPMRYKNPTNEQYVDVVGISGPRGISIASIDLNNDYTLTITYDNNTSTTLGPIRGEVGETPHFTIGSVTEGNQPSATITGTPENPVLNLVLPRVPHNVSELTNDAGYLVADDISNKQDKLTFDNVPTLNSNNPVKSGGVKTAIDTVENKIMVVPGSGVGSARTKNVVYNNQTYINTAEGVGAFAEGLNSQASGMGAHAEGNAKATGAYSHAEGSASASGQYAHAEGKQSIAVGDYSHTEGGALRADGIGAHAEGIHTSAYGNRSHAENLGTEARGSNSHAEGSYTFVMGENTHGEGETTGSQWYLTSTEDSLKYTYSSSSIYSSDSIFMPGNLVELSNAGSPEFTTIAKVDKVRKIVTLTSTLGELNNGIVYIRDGYVSGKNAHSEGQATIAAGNNQHVSGKYNSPDSNNTYAEIIGNGDTVYRSNARALDWNGNEYLNGNLYVQSQLDSTNGKKVAIDDDVPVEYGSGNGSVHTKKFTDNGTTYGQTASGVGSFAHGGMTQASGNFSHAEGSLSKASGVGSHAEGFNATASSNGSHAEGFSTIAASAYQHAQGKNNVADDQNIYANIVGNGTAINARSNAFALTWAGDGKYAGDVYVDANADSSGGTPLARANIIAPVETTATATQAYAVGDVLIYDGKLYKVTAAIAQNGPIIVDGNGVNVEETSIVDNGVMEHGNGIGSVKTKSYVINGTTYKTTANGDGSFATGQFTKASGNSSNASGKYTAASGDSAHSEGSYTRAYGNNSHAEGSGSLISVRLTGDENTRTYITNKTFLIPIGSITNYNDHDVVVIDHATVNNVTTVTLSETINPDSALDNAARGFFVGGSIGQGAHSEGIATIAFGPAQHTQGKYNVPDKLGNYADIVGNGNSEAVISNAYALTWTGDGKYAGDVYVHANNDSSGGTKLATVSEIQKIPVFTTTGGNNPTYSCNMTYAEVLAGVTNKTITSAVFEFSSTHFILNQVEILANCVRFSMMYEARGSVITISFDYNSDNTIDRYESSNDILSHIAPYYEFGMTFPIAQGTLCFHISEQSGGITAIDLYKAKQTIPTSEDWTPAHWELTNIANELTNINSMQIHICTAQEYDAQTGIPTIQNPDASTFYLVPGGDGNNLFIEWAYVNGAWERFGSADVDLSNYVQKMDYATETDAGVIRVSGNYGLVNVSKQDVITGETLTYTAVMEATANNIKEGTDRYRIISSRRTPNATFYGLAKAAGDSTQSQSSNPVGTYTDEAKAAIQQMLGVSSAADVSNKADKADTVFDTTLSRGRKANTTVGTASIAFGVDAEASGYYSTALGLNTSAVSQGAFAEGKNTVARYIAHAEGEDTQALGQWAHSQGIGTVANGAASFAGGDSTIANGADSFVFGKYNIPDSYDNWPTWTANTAYVVGDRVKINTLVQNTPTDVGYYCTTANEDATFDSSKWKLDGYHMNFIEIVGNGDMAIDPTTHEEVRQSSNARTLDWNGNEELAGGLTVNTYLSLGRAANTTIGQLSVALGTGVEASAIGSFATGHTSVAKGIASHAEGYSTLADGGYAHAEGLLTTASGTFAHSDGYNTVASGQGSHTFGYNTVASGQGSHTFGYNSTASGIYSSAEGYSTVANGAITSVQGSSNVIDTLYPDWVENTSYQVGDKVTRNGYGYECKTANTDATWTNANWTTIRHNSDKVFIIGNGSSSNARSNAYALTWTGDGHYAGDVYVHANADSSGGTKLATIEDIPTVPVQDVRVNGTSVLSNGVANVPVASPNTLGVLGYAEAYGVTKNNSNQLRIVKAISSRIAAGTNDYYPIVPSNQHESTFYGLSKVAGVDLANETVTLGTYPETSKTAIRSMIGATSSNVIAVQDTQPTDPDTKIWIPETATSSVQVPTVSEMETALAGKVGDVQIDGASVVSNGIAEIPIGTDNNVGVFKTGGYGVGVYNYDTTRLCVKCAQDNQIKVGTDLYNPIVSGKQHAAAFYGLAKAAGDTTQSASSNAVGTYTDNAKASIKSMLGIVDGSTGTVDITGATPTINAVENTRYVCGEVTSLSFTPPSSGISIVRFTSGSTVTVLTIPSTVKFPEWFDPTALETNTIYEICITDGEFGAVMSWAL